MAKVGTLSVAMQLQNAQFVAGLKQSQAQMQASANAMTNAIGGLKTGLQGLAALFALDALKDAAMRAFDFADAIVDLGAQIGVSTKTIQEFRYAAQLSGSSIEDADTAIAKFAKNIGDAQNGSDAMAKKLRDLGVTSTDVDVALRQVADGIQKLPTQAQRSAATMEVMGKSAGSLSVLLSKGSREMDEMAATAQRLGIVMGDDLLQNAGKVNDQLDTMKMIVNAQFASAIVSNADAISGMATSVISLSSALMSFWGSNPQKAMAIMGALGGAAVGARLGGGLGALGGAVLGGAGGAMFGRSVAESTYTRNTKWAAADKLEKDSRAAYQKAQDQGASRAALERIGKVGLAARKERQRLEKGIDDGSITLGSISLGGGTAGGGGSGTLRTPTGKPTKSKSASAVKLKNDEELLEAWTSEKTRTRGRLEQAEAELANTIDERRMAQQQKLRTELVLRDMEIENDTGTDQEAKEGKKRYTQAQADLLKMWEKETFLAEMALSQREADQAIADERLSISQSGLANQSDLLQADQALARSSGERRDIALRLVALEFQKEKLQLDAIVASQTATAAEKEIAKERLKILGQLQGKAEADVKEQNAGPLEAYLRSIPSTAGEIDDQIGKAQADGLQKLEDGLLDVVKGTGSVKDAFKNMADSIVSQLIRIAIQQAIIKPIANALFGDTSGGGGGGGFLGSLIGSVVKSSVPGARANGGMTAPGSYLVGERGPELVNVGANANVMTNNAFRGLRSGGGGINITFGSITSNDPAAVKRMVYEGIAEATPMLNENAKNATLKHFKRRTI